MAAELDVVVAGAGVVGLAVARALALAGREVVVLEAEDAIGTKASSRNSEVVHAGLYYPTNSRKARFCIAGRRALYAYCEAHGVPFQRCGKLVVATDEAQLPALRALQNQAAANGVEGITWLTADMARALEPALRCTAALHSRETGIVDSHALMRAIQDEATAAGATVLLQSPVLGVEAVADGLRVQVGGEAAASFTARCFVNCAGLDAPVLARGIEGLPAECVPSAHRCKGSYFALNMAPPFSRLVYPMHDGAGLGVHLTLDLAGQARFGPDTEWIDDGAPTDLDVDPARAAGFVAAIRRYWPGLPDGALSPSFAGIRAKIVARGAPAADFRIDGTAVHGMPGLVNLFGIESPGLTASLAIADEVARLVGAMDAGVPTCPGR
jgi:L-2-hydroxyglutarate oxidase LhgO